MKVFISYAWASELHNSWVKKLADELESYEEIDVTFDKYDLTPLINTHQFMEDSIFKSDFILIVGTKLYAEKANNRKGGVGEETFLGTSVHWANMLSDGSTKCIVILKEDGGTPNYLKGQMYIDFKKDEDFDINITNLLNTITGRYNDVRPDKTKSISLVKKNYRLTKVEDLVSISFASKKNIISEAEGTDYSGKNRIKFEVWESAGSFSQTIIIIYPNTTVTQTFERVANEIHQRKIKIRNLSILSEVPKKESLINYLINIDKELYGNIEAVELTYDQYIREHCIGDDFSGNNEISKTDYYVDQELECDGEYYVSSVDELFKVLSSNSDDVCSLLIGDGGGGKSSLCFSLYSKLLDNMGGVPFFISSEAIRSYVEEFNYFPESISSLYDLYEIQAKCNKDNNILDKRRFDISLFSGNMIIIVDGLDEFPSIFGDKFDTSSLLISVGESHSQLGKSKVLITSRDTKFIETEQLKYLDIKKYKLLGFKEYDCKIYIRKRFKGIFDDLNDLTKIESIILKILDDNTFGLDDRVMPFILAQICTIYESSDGLDDFLDFFSNKKLPFKCLNSFTDNLVFGTFRREKVRHSFPITALEMLILFYDFSGRFGNKWPIEKIIEEVDILYDEKSEDIVRCIKINSLLTRSGDYLIIKNDFTFSYFKALYYINTLVASGFYDESVDAFSKLRYDSKEINDLKMYLLKGDFNIIDTIKPVIDFMISKLVSVGVSKAYKAKLIMSIENLFSLSLLSLKVIDKESATSNLKAFFSSGINTIENCYIRGVIPPLNFSSLTISKSKFSDFANFLNSDFYSSQFMYTEFSNCNNPDIVNENLLLAEFDMKTCIIGDLDEAMNAVSENIEKNNELIELECKRFLSSFRKGVYFKDNNKKHIRFSTIVKGLSAKNFISLVREGYIVVGNEKQVDTFYEVAQDFENSVMEFMSNALVDRKMKKFIDYVNT
jgi:hypothetical protein